MKNNQLKKQTEQKIKRLERTLKTFPETIEAIKNLFLLAQDPELKTAYNFLYQSIDIQKAYCIELIELYKLIDDNLKFYQTELEAQFNNIMNN